MVNQKRRQKQDQTLIEEEQKVDVVALKQKIDDMYTNVALNPDGVYHFKMGRELAETLGYPSTTLDLIPDRSIESFAGVGYFFDMAELKRGDQVLDLGSGSGMDTFFAATMVKEDGKITGVDLNEDQMKKAEEMRKSYSIENTEFVSSDIEQLQFDDESFDVVMSNGVFNLIPNKQDLFLEIHRILKPGGKLVFSDIVTESPLPTNVKCNSDLWASCIGGAEQRDNYIRMIENAYLRVKKTRHQEEYSFISDQAKGASEKWGVKSYSFLCIKDE